VYLPRNFRTARVVADAEKGHPARTTDRLHAASDDDDDDDDDPVLLRP
jgi:hypothetical protein